MFHFMINFDIWIFIAIDDKGRLMEAFHFSYYLLFRSWENIQTLEV